MRFGSCHICWMKVVGFGLKSVSWNEHSLVFWGQKSEKSEVLVGHIWNCQGLDQSEGSNTFKTSSVMC